MESNPLNQNYRDNLAAKLMQERKDGNTEKAQRILNEQQGTEFYKDAQDDHRKNEQLTARNEFIDRRIEGLTSLKEKINGAQDVLEHQTPAETNEEISDKEDAQKGFETNSENTDKELQEVLAEKSNLENTSVNPESPEKFSEWSNEELSAEYKKNTDMLEAAGEFAAQSHKEITAEIEQALRKRGLLGETADEYHPTTMDMEQEAHAGLNNIQEPKESSITKTIENEHGGKEVYFNGAQESDFEKENSQNESEKDKETQENEKIRMVGLAAIIASANKSLDWMRGKNAPWATPSMIAREERKLKQAQEAQAEGKETQEDKKTVGAVLAQAAERNQMLVDKAPARSHWLKRNWRKVAAGGALIVALMFTPKGCDFVNADDENKNKVEKVIDSLEEKEVVKEFSEVCAVIEQGDGETQVAKKAFATNPELAKLAKVDVNSPESLKDFGERLKVIDIETGNEIRLGAETIGGQIDYHVYDNGKVVAFFKYNPDDPEAIAAVRSTNDPFTKFEKQSDKEYVQQNESSESKTDKVLDKMVEDTLKWAQPGINKDETGFINDWSDKEELKKESARWNTADDNSVNDPGTANPFNVK